MSEAGGVIAGSEAAARDSAAWAALRADPSIQFAPVPPPAPPVTPEWLLAVGRFLERLLRPLGELLGMDWRWLMGTLLTLAGAGALWLVWVLAIAPWLARRRAEAVAETPEWSPDRAAALALLEDADRLAAAGRYGEAAHLLLLRSVGQIGAARPGLLLPASTAREIGAARALPDRARHAFATIAQVVERSLFALRGAGEGDWVTARTAYAEFALADLLAADLR
ncbi:hypothetical protein [Novosphingobium sp. Gsoil 351]|uniref:hypothetical protein n=1 Tax=Novosphingobium sp. Gsoil 351 TaxID=2675225 RepID=UPI0012B4FE8D|nr:hypothetical protein [Novosphingobium sp. Gsoil 351]QGN54777.1 hypothetical protein GKE62_09640 [Novosphingobium sp. Gsoil 351]